MNTKRLGLIHALCIVVNENKPDDIDRTLALYFLEHYTELDQLNIYDVAEECFTSRSSVRRFCRQIGFENFKDLKDDYKRWDHSYNYFLKLQDKENYIEWFAEEIIAMAREMMERLDAEELEKIAERIHDSRHVVFLTSYSSSVYVTEFQRPLILLGKVVKVMTDLSMDEEYLRNLSDEDYVITVSAMGVFAEEVADMIPSIRARKDLITTSRKREIETGYDQVYHLSTKDHSGVKSMYSKYGMSYLFDTLYNAYYRKYHK